MQDFADNRRDDRVDEGARLERECRATYRGFESHSLRHINTRHGVDSRPTKSPAQSQRVEGEQETL